MLILAIETSSAVSSVAVVSEEKLLAEITVQTKLKHSETLLPHIESLLKMADCPKENLDAIAVSIGPGSFTGLRIGLATAKALSYALKKPLLTVSTLASLAVHFPVPEVTIMPLIDAQKGNAYAACWQYKDGEFQETAETKVLSLAEIEELYQGAEGTVILTGDYAQKKLKKDIALPANVLLAPQHLLMPRAANIGWLGIKKLQKNEVSSVMDAEPVYIRRSEAEVLWDKRHKGEQ